MFPISSSPSVSKREREGESNNTIKCIIPIVYHSFLHPLPFIIIRVRMIGCLRRKKRKEMEKRGMRDVNLFHTRLEKSCFLCIVFMQELHSNYIQSSTRDFDSFPNSLNITIQVSPFPPITSLNSIQLKGFAVYERRRWSFPEEVERVTKSWLTIKSWRELSR